MSAKRSDFGMGVLLVGSGSLAVELWQSWPSFSAVEQIASLVLMAALIALTIGYGKGFLDQKKRSTTGTR
jgi:hypothetical protein